MRKWIARFSFTFLILGALLFYELYKIHTSAGNIPLWWTVVILIGGSLSIALGAQGIRFRHEILRKDD